MKQALIIFARNAILGKVKTRLAQSIGDVQALDIYKKLLVLTSSVTLNLSCDKFVYYTDFINDADSWDNQRYQKRLQHGTDLGERMKSAFHELFSAGYNDVLIIGTDCYQLTTEIIESGLKQLQETDAVIGPTEDGGYYLLGLKKMEASLFEDKAWSTSSVCNHTIRDLERGGLTFFLLPVLRDIDVETDLHEAGAYTKLI